MSLSSLQVLADNREALLLAEVGALIHNIGKFSRAFVRKQAGDSAYADFDHEPITGIIVDYVRAASLSLSGGDRDWIRRLNNHATQQNLTANLLAPDFKDWIKGVAISLPKPLDDRGYKLADLIDLQSQRLYPDQINLLFPSGSHLTQLEAFCHGESSGLEKQEKSLDDTFKQSPDLTFIASAFGSENDANKIRPGQIDMLRATLLNRLKGLINSLSDNWYRELMQKLQILHNGLGDTRRPANEVTLWDFNYSAACLLKPAIVTVLLNGWQEPAKLKWRILRVNFDVLGLYVKAIKIADVLAYRRVIDEACAQVKQLVEVEYPLGNEVYRDTTGIYFTFPDLDLPADLAQEIRRRIEEIEPELAPRIAVEQAQDGTATEQLKRLLADARAKAQTDLAQPFSEENFSSRWQAEWDKVDANQKWEVCPVCRLRPMREGEEACELCDKRRTSRVATWKENPAQTIWLDEIADHNDRVALIVGKFGLDDWLSGDLVQTLLVKAVENNPDECVPKNPSPARLRRVWETCERFWTETVEREILAKHEYGKGTKSAELRRARVGLVPDHDNWNEGMPYDGTINGQVISLLWLKEEGRFVTISNLQLAAGQARSLVELVAEWHGRTVQVSASDKPNERKTFVIRSVPLLTDNKREYAPYLRLLASPDQFLALVPACDALEIAEKIRDEYRKQFGKVQNRLPLFLGLVFFPRKTPLAAVMDTARRMLAVPVSREQWTVDSGTVGQECVLELKQDEREMTLRVPTMMGDGTTPDIWYPYFFIEGSPNGRKYSFQCNGRWLVHVNDLRAGDVVRVMPSRFAYVWLEHTARRFEFDASKDVMLLDELVALREMWEKIRATPDMTDTKLRSVQALLEAKWHAWRLDEESSKTDGRRETFKRLAKTEFQRAGLAIDADDALNGRFRRCLELDTKILKQKVKED